MKAMRLSLALAFAILGAAAIAEAAGGKPDWAPPSNPPSTLLEVLCSYLPSLPVCD